MIITRQKPLDDILGYIHEYKRVLITGCDGCYQPPRAEKESEIMGLLITLKGKLESSGIGHEVKAVSTLRQCDDRILAASMRPLLKEYQPDAIVSMACGVGVQLLAKTTTIPVYPGQDTLFIGAEIHQDNKFEELCEACGDCLLGETGGVCPVVNCAKNLMNGPCGGTIEGMCEVGNYAKPCAWVEIWKVLKDRGRLDMFKLFRMPRDYRSGTSPREISIKETFPDVSGPGEQVTTKEVAEIE